MARTRSAAYRIRRHGSGSQTSASLTVPMAIAELIPDNLEFEIELVDEGILFRARPIQDMSDLPEWVKNGQTSQAD